jgi:hypothetical protein
MKTVKASRRPTGRAIFLNQYTQQTPATSFTYDDDGNLINDGTKTYVYDAENRLIEIWLGTWKSYEAGYDYQGRMFVDKYLLLW